MKMIRIIGTVAALLLPATIAPAGASSLVLRVGDAYEIIRTQESVQKSSDGASGSGHDRDAIIEKVIGLRPDGVELEYDLPKSTPAEERADTWQFPVRIFAPFHGSAQLLNGPELEGRVDDWLKAAKWTRAACGHWIFTWDAFRIECDPQSVLKTIGLFDMKDADLGAGASYRVEEALAPATMERTLAPQGAVFTAEMRVDPDAVRRARAESDVVVGGIVNKPVSLEDALRARANETVAGTILVKFETDAAGVAYRRTTVTKLNVTRPDGRSERQTVTETLDRRQISTGR